MSQETPGQAAKRAREQGGNPGQEAKKARVRQVGEKVKVDTVALKGRMKKDSDAFQRSGYEGALDNLGARRDTLWAARGFKTPDGNVDPSKIEALPKAISKLASEKRKRSLQKAASTPTRP